MSKKKRLAREKAKLENAQLNENRDDNNRIEDTSPKVWQREKIKFALNIRERTDFTEKQKVILQGMLDKKTRGVFIDGLWGTSKSYLCILAALKLLNTGRIDEIIYVRNPVESSTTGKIGFLKGETDEKMAPYAAILHDKLEELLPKTDIEKLKKDNRFKCLPLGFTRGLSWNCKAIIVDEAASLTYDDIALLLSRCGEFTRIFFIGDSLNQNDIGSKSGFSKIFNIFRDEESKNNGIFTFELKDKEDIVRSGFVKFVMQKIGAIK